MEEKILFSKKNEVQSFLQNYTLSEYIVHYSDKQIYGSNYKGNRTDLTGLEIISKLNDRQISGFLYTPDLTDGAQDIKLILYADKTNTSWFIEKYEDHDSNLFSYNIKKK